MKLQCLLAFAAVLLCCFTLFGDKSARAVGVVEGHSAVLDRIPSEVVTALASVSAPNPQGAIGRNRGGYFHARFQYGAHRLADAGLQRKDSGVIAAFVRSIEYAFKHQEPNGGFALVIPDRLRGAGTPTPGDLASANAFFLATAGAGLVALQQSPWFSLAPENEASRDTVEELQQPMQLALKQLVAQRELLASCDSNAPNRVLISGLAFCSLGTFLDDGSAVEIGKEFVASALGAQHRDGYFIEAGGRDSSYNGVALAIGYRLITLGYDIPGLRDALGRAAKWQATQVLPSGEIDTEDNTRVYPGGEAFLGREKDVDAGHTVEGFALAYGVTRALDYRELAHRVLHHYSPATARPPARR